MLSQTGTFLFTHHPDQFNIPATNFYTSMLPVTFYVLQNVSRLCCQSCWFFFCSPVTPLISLSPLPCYSSHLTEIHKAASLHFQWLKIRRCLKILNKGCTAVGNAVTIPGWYVPHTYFTSASHLRLRFLAHGARASFSDCDRSHLHCWMLPILGEFLMNTSTVLRLILFMSMNSWN